MCACRLDPLPIPLCNYKKFTIICLHGIVKNKSKETRESTRSVKKLNWPYNFWRVFLKPVAEPETTVTRGSGICQSSS